MSQMHRSKISSLWQWIRFNTNDDARQ